MVRALLFSHQVKGLALNGCVCLPLVISDTLVSQPTLIDPLVCQVCVCWTVTWRTPWRHSHWAWTRSTSRSTAPAGDQMTTGARWTGPPHSPARPSMMASHGWVRRLVHKVRNSTGILQIECYITKKNNSLVMQNSVKTGFSVNLHEEQIKLISI